MPLFTAGEWRQVDQDIGLPGVIVANLRLPGLDSIPGSLGGCYRERAANGRLIVNAPKMYDLLRSLVDVVCEDDREDICELLLAIDG